MSMTNNLNFLKLMSLELQIVCDVFSYKTDYVSFLVIIFNINSPISQNTLGGGYS